MPIVGVSNLHYAIMNQDDVSGIAYAAPVHIADLIEIGINPNVKTKTLFTDNGPSRNGRALGVIEVEINIADLDLSTRAVWLGKTIVGGVLTDYSTDTPPDIALGFEALKENGSKEYVWLLKGNATEPEDKYKTQEDDVNFQTKTIKLTFLKRKNDNAWRRKTDEDHVDYVEVTGTNWFNSVTGTTPDALTCATVPADAATNVAVDSNITFTFNNAIQISDMVADNFFVFKASDGTLVPGVLSIDADRKVVTLNPNVDLAAATAYILVVTQAVRDIYGQTVAAGTVIGNFTTAA